MKIFGRLKRDFFTSNSRINFEVYCQPLKITPEASGEKGLFLVEAQFKCWTSHLILWSRWAWAKFGCPQSGPSTTTDFRKVKKNRKRSVSHLVKLVY